MTECTCPRTPPEGWQGHNPDCPQWRPLMLGEVSKAEAGLRMLGDVQRLNLQKDDVLVLTLTMDVHISDAALQNIKNKLEQLVPGRRVLVLNKGAELRVIHKVKR